MMYVVLQLLAGRAGADFWSQPRSHRCNAAQRLAASRVQGSTFHCCERCVQAHVAPSCKSARHACSQPLCAHEAHERA
eukprot:4057061-Pleurochrysis_carterae.AAC.2